jgi:hypothetical protein
MTKMTNHVNSGLNALLSFSLVIVFCVSVTVWHPQKHYCSLVSAITFPLSPVESSDVTIETILSDYQDT